MNRLHVTTKAHQWMTKIVKPDDVVVDATAGNGNDTLFLSKLAKEVIAFDVQQEAIDNTQQRCIHQSNVRTFCVSHVSIFEVVETFDVLVFNLGYLPNSDSTLCTQTSTTLTALKNNLPHLNKKGHLLITYYRKHPGGNDEYEAVSSFLAHDSGLECLETYTYDDDLAPVFQIFQKR
jgi:methylase of polypeptide subunit release factors